MSSRACHPSRVGEANMGFAHWLIVAGTLLVFAGLVGGALQKKRAAPDPSSLEQGTETDGQTVREP